MIAILFRLLKWRFLRSSVAEQLNKFEEFVEKKTARLKEQGLNALDWSLNQGILLTDAESLTNLHETVFH